MKIIMKLVKRPSGYYNIVFYDENNKRHFKSLKTKNKNEAQTLFNSFKKAYLQKKIDFINNEKQITLSNFTDKFLDLISASLRSDTIISYQIILKKFNDFIQNKFGDILLKNIDTQLIDEYITFCQKDKKNKNVTVNKDLRHLRAFFNKAIEYKYLKENPITTKKFLKVDRQVKFLTTKQIKEYLDNVKDENFKRFLLFVYYTGCRKKEAMNVMWTDINLDDGYIIFRETKVHDFRIVPIPEPLYKILKEMKPTKKVSKEVFKYTSYAISHRVRRLSKKLGIPVTTHKLRHSYATHLLQKGVAIDTIQDLLGHKEISTTRIYAKTLNENKLKASKIISGIFD